MDFAPEPVRDAFPLPQTRAGQTTTAPADDDCRSFGDHLDTVNEPQVERPAPATTAAREEPAAPISAEPDDSKAPADEDVDPDVALLGGPALPAPPPLPAPIAIQIVASQPAQAPPAQVQPDDALITPSSPAQSTPPAGQAEDLTPAAATQPAPSDDAHADKPAVAEAKDATAKTAPIADPSPTQSAPTGPDATLNATQQSASKPVTTDALPPAVQQAIAATMAPTLTPATTQTATRAKDATQVIDAKATVAPREGKAEAPPANAKNQANAAKSADGGKISPDPAPTPPTQGAAPDPANIAEASANTTTASQASTHVQHASAETGAHRAAPAAVQVGREVIRRFNGGATNFELRLDPADLGRVEVKLEVTRDNKVTAVITADNPQALTELARGARDLEQQLQSAGLQLGENGLSFDLRQGSQGGESDQQNNSNARGDGNAGGVAEQQQAPVARPIGYERWRGVRVDMMV